MTDQTDQPTDASKRAEQRSARKRARRSWRLKQREKRSQARAERAETAPEAASETAARKRRVRRGVVTSAKADKTITVRIDQPRPHRIYKKVVRASSTLHAHDERNEASEGDTVRLIESRPRSRTKRWRLVEVVERAR
jgi:small subunit ribosomal protein S17